MKGIIAFQPDAIFYGMSCFPGRKHSRNKMGNPSNKPTIRMVHKLLWKRSLGLTIKAASLFAGWKSDVPARKILSELGYENDLPRSLEEVRKSAVADYVSGGRLVDIAKKYGFGASSISRWVREAGASESPSRRKALHLSIKPAGRECIGRKGLYHTTKGNRWIATDSVYEYARVDQHENDDGVVSIDRCKERVSYVFEGVVRTYIPDLRVEYSGGATFIEEVKPVRWVDDPKVLAKAEAARKHFVALGIGYRIVTEIEIGDDLIADCAKQMHDRLDPSYKAEMREKRLAQKREAGARYYKKKTGKLAA